jgi:hypothetical protein
MRQLNDMQIVTQLASNPYFSVLIDFARAIYDLILQVSKRQTRISPTNLPGLVPGGNQCPSHPAQNSAPTIL